MQKVWDDLYKQIYVAIKNYKFKIPTETPRPTPTDTLRSPGKMRS